MTITLIQEAHAGIGTTPITASLDDPPTDGNLIVGMFWHKWTSFSSHTGHTNPAELPTSVFSDCSSETGFAPWVEIRWAIADSFDEDFTWTHTDGFDTIDAYVAEYSTDGGDWDMSIVDVAHYDKAASADEVDFGTMSIEGLPEALVLAIYGTQGGNGRTTDPFTGVTARALINAPSDINGAMGAAVVTVDTDVSAIWTNSVSMAAVAIVLAAEEPPEPDPPDAIDDLVATAGIESVTLSWTAPDNGGAAITDYEIEVDGGSWMSLGQTSTGYFIDGLTAGVEVDYRVRAVNSAGNADPSNEDSATPTAVVPPTPFLWEQVSPPGADLSSEGNFGFQSMAIDVDGTVYVTADHDGLWRSTNFGGSWVKVSTDGKLESGTPWTLYVDPTDTDVIWSNAGYGDGGPMKSTDGGATWTLMTVPGRGHNDIYCVAIDPADNDHVLVAWHTDWTGQSSSGISETFNGGTTWTNHDAPTDDWGSGHGVWFLSDDETWLVGTQDDGIWRTDDSGSTWTQVDTLSITHGATDALKKIGSTLYLAHSGRISMSTDDGETWTNISSGLTPDNLSAVADDGTNLYTLASFPIAGNNGAAEGPMYTRPIAGGTWAEMSGQPDMTWNSVSNGPRMEARYGDYIFTSNYRAGVWRYYSPPGIFNLFDGADTVDAVYIGSTAVDAIYDGSTVVYQT